MSRANIIEIILAHETLFWHVECNIRTHVAEEKFSQFQKVVLLLNPKSNKTPFNMQPDLAIYTTL